jgi:hypothetical protein
MINWMAVVAGALGVFLALVVGWRSLGWAVIGICMVAAAVTAIVVQLIT